VKYLVYLIVVIMNGVNGPAIVIMRYFNRGRKMSAALIIAVLFIIGRIIYGTFNRSFNSR